MRQYAHANFCGIVSSIKKDLPNNKLTVLLTVNRADSYNLHISNRAYYVTFFNGAFKSIVDYIGTGDTLILENVEMVIDYAKKSTYLNVQRPEQIMLIAVENRSTLTNRVNQNQPPLEEFDNV